MISVPRVLGHQRDLDEALEWAQRTVVVQQRPIEVRPFFDGDPSDAIRADVPGAQ
jgi:hypothetical protein